MSKVTSKFQVSIPKTLAERIGIRIGDELEWQEAAGTLRARAATPPEADFPVSERLRLFDAATARQEKRERAHRVLRGKRRGEIREDLYRR
jgi:AbrB family looped-hinge helix DNA binding protein